MPRHRHSERLADPWQASDRLLQFGIEPPQEAVAVLPVIEGLRSVLPDRRPERAAELSQIVQCDQQDRGRIVIVPAGETAPRN